MTEIEVFKEITSRYLNKFSSQFPIAVPNKAFTEPDQGTWVQMIINFNTDARDTVNAIHKRRNLGIGLAIFDVNTDRDSGVNSNLAICTESRDLYNDLRFGDLWFFNGGIRTIGNVNQFFKQRVSVEFNFEYIR